MSEGQSTKEYYALCARFEEGGEYEIAPLLLEETELGTVLAFAIYSSEDGPQQREDLAEYEGDTAIRRVGPRELLDAMERDLPNSVFVDGRKYGGSRFRAALREALGMPPFGPLPE